jgi:hypothetical protein
MSEFSRRSFLTAATAGAVSIAGLPAAAATFNSTKILRDEAKLLGILERAPYISEGSGTPLYVLMSERCPVCKAMWRDHRSVRSNVEFRWIPGAYGTDDMNQAAQVMQSRRLDDFERFMSRTLPAADMHAESGKIAAYNNMIMSLNAIHQIATMNGGKTGTPMAFWTKDGATSLYSGYGPDSFKALLNYLSA